MNGKENIIQRILDDAEVKCTQIVDNANKSAEQIVAQAKAVSQSDFALLQHKLEAQRNDKVNNAILQAQMESRKYALAQKQALIGQCYDKAKQSLASLSDKERGAFLRNVLTKFAEDGETVFVNANDSKLVTDKLLAETGKKLTLGKTTAGIDGGVILEGDGYVKDLSLTRLIDYARQNTEGAVAHALFGNE